MRFKLKVGDFGHFIFSIQHKSKFCYGYHTTHFDVYGAEVMFEDKLNIILKTDEDLELLVSRDNITFYEPMKKRVKIVA